MLDNIYLTGGNTLVKNFDQKFKENLKQEGPENLKFNLINNNNRFKDSFRGSHFITDLAKYKESRITKD